LHLQNLTEQLTNVEYLVSDILRMSGAKGRRPLRGARGAPLTPVIRREDFLLSAAANAAAEYQQKILPPLQARAKE
jgi:hypothetical protein